MHPNHTEPMSVFHDLMRGITENGSHKGNRTGTGTKFLPCRTVTYDLADGFPAITSRKLAFKSAKGELIGMWRGYQNSSDFDMIDCPVWHDNANKTKEWLESPYRKGPNDIGRAYGAQFTDYRDWRSATTPAEAQRLESAGYTLIAYDQARNTWVYRRSINQLEENLKKLITNPEDRRIITTAWNPAEMDMGALPACHYSYNLVSDTEKRELHLMCVMRSWDVFLAFNSTIAALWLAIFAKMSGFTPRTCMIAAADAHIYDNMREKVATQLTRSHFSPPRLFLGDSIPVISSMDQIPGVFTRINPHDIQLLGYRAHGVLTAKMAA